MNIFLLVTLILLLVFSTITILINYFYGKLLSLLSGLILGIVMLTIILIVKANATIIDSNIEQTNNILGLPIAIFVKLIMIAIPFYLFFVIASLILSNNFGSIKKSTYAVSFLSLFALSIIGVLMAILMIPLILLIPSDWWNLSNLSGEAEEAGGLYLWFLIVAVLLSIVASTITRFVAKDNRQKIIEYNNVAVGFVNNYFTTILFLIPSIVIIQITKLSLFDEFAGTVSLLGAYMVIYWLGAIIIFGLLFAFNILLADGDVALKEKISILFNQILTVFANQSTTASLPTTQENAQKLGVCKEISILTPSKGTFMGMIMCNGFAPMLIIEFTLAWAGALSVSSILIMALIVLSLAIVTSGSGSADLFIITTALGFGIFDRATTELFFAVLMPGQEFNEKVISKTNNTLGHMAATQVTEKWHRKTATCDCKENVGEQNEPKSLDV